MRQPAHPQRRIRILTRLAWIAGLSVLLLLRFAAPPRDLTAVGPVAFRDLALTLATYMVFLVLAAGAGLRLLDHLRPPNLTRLSKLCFAFALGTTSASLLVLLLGLTSALTPLSLSLVVIFAAGWLGPDVNRMARNLPVTGSILLKAWRELKPSTRIGTVLLLSIGGLSFLNTLGPPWDYDGLMYHLLGPKLFVEAGRLYPVPDNWYLNGPLSIEMLFSFGLAFRDDVFPKLVHFSFGVAYVLATYLIARYWLPKRTAVLACVILIGVPTLPIWATFAYIDLGWSAYELLSLAALLFWCKTLNRSWLIISGLLIGAAAASKYLGLQGVAIGGIAVLILSLPRGSRPALQDMGTFGASAMLVAGPWYLRNALWFGNPIFPLVIGGPGWDPERLRLYMEYLASFGVGREPIDFVLLPLNVYLRHTRFGTVMNTIDIPSLLFPLAALAPLFRPHRAVRLLLWIALARIALWSVGSQQLRFLLPVYPVLAILAAHSIDGLSGWIRRPAWRILLPGLAIGLAALTAYYQVVVLVQFSPLPPAFGLESIEDFRLRINKDYAAIRAFQRAAAPSDRLLMIGDARGYLCPDQCIPDPDHFRWAAEIVEAHEAAGLQPWFDQKSVTHVLWSVEDLDFLLQHDPQNVLRRALRVLLDYEQAGCLTRVFQDEWSTLYRLQCLEG